MSSTAESILERHESEVRSYSRSFPAVFVAAKGSWLMAEDGTRYLDFLAGAGSLNYGHNPDDIKAELISYLKRDGLTHGLDLATSAKADFLAALQNQVLLPRGLNYKVQFCSPSGTNAVEAALKLARLVTGRSTVVSFAGGFHGVSAGALAVCGSAYHKQGLFAELTHTTTVPFPDSPFGPFDTLDLLRRLVEDPSSGIERPAAVIIEVVQGEGGVYVASPAFLRGLRAVCDRHGILLIVDEIQVGCGRTGPFFSFEDAGIVPDLVTVAKSIGGYGLPMALLLIRPEHDVWSPGQHNGTFRGHQLAFVAAASALRRHWSDATLTDAVRSRGEQVGAFLRDRITGRFGLGVRGTGLIWGIDFGAHPTVTAGKVSRLCFDKRLMVETCGRGDTVLKLLPPLTISAEDLHCGLETIAAAIAEIAAD